MKYFFPAILFAFLGVYFSFEKIRIRKLEKRLEGKDMGYVKKIKASLHFSILIIFGSLCFASWCTFFPRIHYDYPIDVGAYDLSNAIGMLIIKLSFISLLISGLLVSKEIDSSPGPQLFKNLYRSELLMLFLVAFLSCGVFIFVSNAGTLILFTASVFSFFWHRKLLRDNGS